MSDFSKSGGLGPLISKLQQDIEGSLARSSKNSISSAQKYSAASAADWDDNAPTTVGEALDRIAAMLGPIT